MKYEPAIKEDEIKRARRGDAPLKWCNWDELNAKHKERKEFLSKIKELYPET
jgi:hypothetical protein